MGPSDGAHIHCRYYTSAIHQLARARIRRYSASGVYLSTPQISRLCLLGTARRDGQAEFMWVVDKKQDGVNAKRTRDRSPITPLLNLLVKSGCKWHVSHHSGTRCITQPCTATQRLLLLRTQTHGTLHKPPAGSHARQSR